jgi:hypothetical protein
MRAESRRPLVEGIEYLYAQARRELLAIMWKGSLRSKLARMDLSKTKVLGRATFLRDGSTNFTFTTDDWAGDVSCYMTFRPILSSFISV